jgi:hypothetical protein
MKKTKQGGLKLRVETVRQLTGADLRSVAGGQIGNGSCSIGSHRNPDSCATLEDDTCVAPSQRCAPQNSFGVCW